MNPSANETNEYAVVQTKKKKMPCCLFLALFFGILAAIAFLIMLIYLMVRMDDVDQRMGGLHGDEDRDLKQTHHHTLVDHIKELKDALVVLERKVDDLTRLTKNETDEIDDSLIKLSSKVGTDTKDIDDAIVQLSNKVSTETKDIDDAIITLSTKVGTDTGDIDSAISTLSEKLGNDTQDIDDAIKTLSNKVDTETDAIDSAIEALNKNVTDKTKDIDEAIVTLNQKVGNETGKVNTAVSDLSDKVASETGAIDNAIDALSTKVGTDTGDIDDYLESMCKASRFRNCFHFPADVCKAVEITPKNPARIDDFTVDAWYKLTNLTANPTIVAATSNDNDDEFFIALRSGYMTDTDIYGGGTPAALGTYERRTVTRKSNKTAVYVDGVKKLSFDVTADEIDASSKFVLGQEPGDVGKLSNYTISKALFGSICDFQMWNKALTEAELGNLFQPSTYSEVERGNVFDNPPSYTYEIKTCTDF